MSIRLGIDLGGTSAKVAVVDLDNRIVGEGEVATKGTPRPGELARTLADTCRRLLKGKKIRRIGIGVAGDIDSERGLVRVSPNLGWKNVPLRKLFAERMHCPVVIENDASATAWGVYKTQVPNSVKHMIVITLGTGVGGGLIIDGKLHRGATGSAGEVGHLNIEENGRLCHCGNRGCLEAYVGGPYVVKKVKKDLAQGKKSRLQAIYRKNPALLTPLEIASAAKAGDTYARSIWTDVGRALGIAVGDLVYLLNPQMIFFTGGIAQAGTLFLKPLRQTLFQRAFKTPVQAVRIQVATNASQVGVIGAALL